jgi:membrane fusion protein, multidrug efflux system
MRHPIFLRAFLCSGLLLPIGLAGCGQQGDQEGGPSEPMVRVAMPSKSEVQDYEYFTGRTVAKEYEEIRPQVSGYLVKINFKPGSDVKKDEVLFQIDQRPYKAALDQAKSQVALNEAKLSLAVASLARGNEIAKTKGAISQQELDQLAAEEKAAAAAVQSAKANVESAKLDFEFTDVISHTTGAVGLNRYTEGNLVSKGELLTTVASMNPMYAYFNVNEHSLLRVKKLMRDGKIKSSGDDAIVPVEFGLANEGDTYPHKGNMDFVNNELDSSTGTLQVRGILDNPKIGTGKTSYVLSPGLFVRVRFPVGSPQEALLVPQAAVGTDLGKKFVFVVNDKNIVENREIIPGPIQPGGLQVAEPVKMKVAKDGIQLEMDSLTASDKIVVGGLQRIHAGSKVKIKESK